MARASALHRHTPTLAVRDARGLALRQVAYCRTGSEQAARRVILARHDVAGQLRQQWDPRLFEMLEQDSAVAPNQHALTSLSDRPLLDDSSDAGWQLMLPGDAGQVVERWDTRGSHWHTRFDERLRPLRIEEGATGQPVRVSTGFTYAVEAGLNRRGRLVRQDDEAGSRWIDSYALTGQVRSETRHFLATLDLPDWPDAVLEPGDGASTTFIHGPLQEVLAQTDALGNRQSFHFDLSGELKSLVLQLEDGTEHPMLTDARYNAFGQIESQTAGNGVLSYCEYEPATGRLSRLSASRPGRALLQDLRYDYDPVGNVLKIEDHSQPVSHFANQRVDPVSTFSYDSLYQLTDATGREALGVLIGPQLPELAPNPGDTSRLLNYRQHYQYDASGNLLELRHIGQQSYTRTLNVADHSNHAVPAPGDPLTAFDANGNLLELAAGQPLHWNARNQLHRTRQVAREEGADDEEHYRYGSDGLRMRKIATRLVSGRLQSSETRYLPGLELHTRPGESFAVITAQAGRCSVRCLYWSEGAPDGLANPQLRYSLDDQLGSSSLELDDEARIISHEAYYPFGGSAWWAASSAIEASYKTRRYSGKERDAGGLYDYGLRYYAPWLMRWINPDPAGDVDGLNRYRFVRNNPATWVDPLGLNPDLYDILPFSKFPKEPASEHFFNEPGRSGLKLKVDGPVAEFAYDTVWSVKNHLSRGAGNLIGDVLSSGYASFAYAGLISGQLPEEQTARESAEHGLAVLSGYCDQFAAVATLLMASSPDWPGVPVFLARQPKHKFALLGDPRQEDALVVDGWATFPMPHHLSQSLNVQTKQWNFTPRMPGDPTDGISRTRVSELRDTLYSEPVDLSEALRKPQIEREVAGSTMFTRSSTLREPQGITANGLAFNLASVPQMNWDWVLDAYHRDMQFQKKLGLR